MNLIKRYVEAVKVDLPADVKEDVGSELMALLEEKAESLEQQKGSTLTEDEIVKMLEDYGHPFKVASAYRRRTVLISETAFPLYKRALGFILSLYLLGAVVLMLVKMHVGEGVWGVIFIPEFIHDVVDILMFGFLLITVFFHYFGERANNVKIFWHWNPRKLPNVFSQQSSITFYAAFIAIISEVFYLSLLSVSSFGYRAEDWSVRLNENAVTSVLLLKLLVGCALLISLYNLYQRYWTRLKLIIMSAIGLAAILGLLNIVRLDDILISTAGFSDDAFSQAKELKEWLAWGPDLYARAILIAIIAITAYRCFKMLRASMKISISGDGNSDA